MCERERERERESERERERRGGKIRILQTSLAIRGVMAAIKTSQLGNNDTHIHINLAATTNPRFHVVVVVDWGCTRKVLASTRGRREGKDKQEREKEKKKKTKKKKTLLGSKMEI